MTAVTYPSQDPIAKTLKSFQIDITANPAMHELLEQLRGARVTVALGAEKVAGTVLGVENKQRPAGNKDGAPIDAWYINLITGEGAAVIRSLPLDEVRDVVLEDPRLREELSRALSALAQARDQDKKPVTIRFSGQGERRVRIGYVVETPVWKTSYRLLLTENAQNQKAPDDPEKADSPRALAAKNENVSTAGNLQGWAIVENQTDNDWTEVELSLVSGRPISFIQDLYQPLYIPRPIVEPELYASLKPQTYDAGMEKAKDLQAFGRSERDADGATKRNGVDQLSRARKAGRQVPMLSSPLALPLESPWLTWRKNRRSMPVRQSPRWRPLPSWGSCSSIRSGASRCRAEDAMIPIVTDPVEVEKLSIFNAAVLPRNPLNGARIKNTTGKHLLQGPVTVLDAGSYAGDARIDDVPPGQERLISYGVDQQVLVHSTVNKTESSLRAGSIVKGVLHLSYKDVFTQNYISENKGDRNRTLIVEHPLHRGWKLIEPAKADETTETLYRFKGGVPAGKASELTVVEEQTRGEAIAILPMDAATIEFYIKSGVIAQPVKDALAKAAQLKGVLVDTQRQIQERETRIRADHRRANPDPRQHENGRAKQRLLQPPA